MGETINGVYIPSQDDLLLHYGKKGMKWKKHLTNGVNSALEGIENAANWIDDQTFDKNRDRALRDRSESNKRRINDPKYGKTYNTASDPVDGKKNVDVKRALQEGRDNVVPSRSREGMRQENKYIEKIRKRVKLPRLKQGISSEDTLLHYGKKGMKWKKKGEGAIGIGTVGAAPAFQDKALERRAIIERLIAKEHDKAAKKTNDPKKKEIRKELREKAKKNSKELEKKRESMYNPYRGDKLPKKKVKHSGISEDTLLHYGKKGMKWKKKGVAGSAPMTPAEMAIIDARTKKEGKSYEYNKKMREKALENAIKRGASGKEIRKLQGMLKDDERKLAMNKDHKDALKKKDFRRSSYERSYVEIDASNGNKPKVKKYKY